jgi:DNA polymerase (family 10)
MPVHNADIARALDEIADLLEIQGANVFRVRAYRDAARTVGDLRIDIAQMIAAGEPLPKLPGIGEDLERKLHDLATSGTTEILDRLHRELPPAISELLRVPALGPKRVRILHEALGVTTLEELRDAARSERIRAIKGFGAKTEASILAAVEARLIKKRRFPLPVAARYAESIVDHLRALAGVREAVVAGSFRRMKESVGDLDVLVTTDDPEAAIQRFVAFADVHEVTASGSTRASGRHVSGLQVDLRVVRDESFGAALHYFTGAKAHNIAIRRLGQDAGLKVNEYGVFTSAPGLREERIAGETEASVFASVGLPWIPPELREDSGEIEAARAGALPKLVERDDLRGDVRFAMDADMREDALAGWARAAAAHGLEYGVIVAAIGSGAEAAVDRRRVARLIAMIERARAKAEPAVLISGIEAGIREDGTLDLPDAILAQFDVVVVAVHSDLGLSRGDQTTRIARALQSSRVDVLAPPRAPSDQDRAGYDVDMLRIVREARERGVTLALVADPQRIGLSDVQCRMAKEEGVQVIIGSHGLDTLGKSLWALGQARRGWLEADDVLNARRIDPLRAWLRKRKAATAARPAGADS